MSFLSKVVIMSQCIWTQLMQHYQIAWPVLVGLQVSGSLLEDRVLDHVVGNFTAALFCCVSNRHKGKIWQPAIICLFYKSQCRKRKSFNPSHMDIKRLFFFSFFQMYLGILCFVCLCGYGISAPWTANIFFTFWFWN